MFNRPRIIPCLLIDNRKLVKTIRFKNPRYLGDPINAIKIFNEKEVDELCILDIRKYNLKKIDFEYLRKMTTEAFMPLSYGGGIQTIDEVTELFRMGFEKVILNTALVERPILITDIVNRFGSQSIVASVDVKDNIFGRKNCYIRCGTKKIEMNPVDLCIYAESLGVGEIFLNSITRDGMMSGYDIAMLKEISSSVNVPVIACGGAGKLQHFHEAIVDGGAHAVAGGSIFLYYGAKKAVLISYPSEDERLQAEIYGKGYEI